MALIPRESAETAPSAVDHAAALQEYLGPDAAESFLHPRPQSNSRAERMFREKTTTTLKSLASDANDVWGSLRADSRARVAQRSQDEAERLREAYNTYARDCIARRMAPVPRMFGDDDYSMFRNMLANPRSRPALERRRRKEMMFRQSQQHQDTYQVLTHNNPLPLLARCYANAEDPDAEVAENLGVGRFLPPRTGSPPQDEASDTYRAFDVTRKYDELELAAQRRYGRTPNPVADPYLRRDLDSAGERRSRGNYDSLRYRLVDAAACAGDGVGVGGGDFSARFAAEFAAANDPMSVIVKQTEERQAARERRSALAAATAAALTVTPQTSQVARRLPPLAEAAAAPGRQSAPVTLQERLRTLGWQPLSLGALLDYAKDVAPTAPPPAAPAAFRFGRVPVWRTGEAVPTASVAAEH